jgi:hypothetical protein
VTLVDGEIIDVELAPCPLELVEFVRDEPPTTSSFTIATSATICSFASRSSR